MRWMPSSDGWTGRVRLGLAPRTDAGVSPARTWPLSGGLMKASISSSTGASPTLIRRRRGFHNRPNSAGELIAA